MTESDWVRYFRANAAEPSLPWDDGYRLSGAERTIVIQSIQQFQLGENAQGQRLLERAKRGMRNMCRRCGCSSKKSSATANCWGGFWRCKARDV